MNCHNFELWIALDVGGDLPETDQAKLQAHLTSCPQCRRLADEMIESRESLRALHREPLDVSQLRAIRMRAVEQLKAEVSRRRERFAWWVALRPSWTRLAVLTTGAVVAAGLAWWVAGPGQPGGPAATPGKNQPGLAAVPPPPAMPPMPVPDDSGVLPSNDERVQTAVAAGPEGSVPRPQSEAVEITDPTPAPRSQPPAEPLQQQAEEPAAPERPRYELVSVPVSDPEGGESEQYLLRVASDNPNIEIYWILDENGD